MSPPTTATGLEPITNVCGVPVAVGDARAPRINQINLYNRPMAVLNRTRQSSLDHSYH